jgi:tRNA-specific adenosine deaminase 2
MKEALVVAQEAYDHLEVPVGCVFVLNNETIIARGRNKPNESCNVRKNIEYLILCILIAINVGYTTCRNRSNRFNSKRSR